MMATLRPWLMNVILLVKYMICSLIFNLLDWLAYFSTRRSAFYKKYPGPCVTSIIDKLDLHVYNTRFLLWYCLVNSTVALHFSNHNHENHVCLRHHGCTCKSFVIQVKPSNLFDIFCYLNTYGEAQTRSKNDQSSHDLSKKIKDGSILCKKEDQLVEPMKGCERATSTKYLPLFKKQDSFVMLHNILSTPLINHFFGKIESEQNKDEWILYSDEFPINAGLVSIPKTDLLSVQNLYSATIICNSQEESLQYLDELLDKIESKRDILVISNNDRLESTRDKKHITWITRENLVALDKQMETYAFVIIDDPKKFNLRSKYKEVLFKIEYERMILLYPCDSCENYVQLSGIKKLQDVVPQTAKFWAYLRTSVIKLEPFLSKPTLEFTAEEITTYKPYDNLQLVLTNDVPTTGKEVLQEVENKNLKYTIAELKQQLTDAEKRNAQLQRKLEEVIGNAKPSKIQKIH